MLPIVREMLVHEDGATASAFSKDVHDLFEELVTGVELLLLFVVGVIAMLANESDAVDGQAAGAQRKGSSDVLATGTE